MWAPQFLILRLILLSVITVVTSPALARSIGIRILSKWQDMRLLVERYSPLLADSLSPQRPGVSLLRKGRKFSRRTRRGRDHLSCRLACLHSSRLEVARTSVWRDVDSPLLPRVQTGVDFNASIVTHVPFISFLWSMTGMFFFSAYIWMTNNIVVGKQ